MSNRARITITLRDAGVTISPTTVPSWGGYQATVTIHDEEYSAPVVRIYGTGRDGRGLWVTESSGNESQVRGAAQFVAPSAASFRRQLRKHLRAKHIGI